MITRDYLRPLTPAQATSSGDNHQLLESNMANSIGDVMPLQVLTQPAGGLPHNEEVDRELLVMIHMAIREAFPDAIVTKSERLPNPPKSVTIVEHFPGTNVALKDETFVLEAGPGGPMAKFPLTSHAIRRFAMRNHRAAEMFEFMDMPTQGVSMSFHLYAFGNPYSFYVNYVSTGLGIENKFMVFYTTNSRHLPIFLDEVLQLGGALSSLWDPFVAFHSSAIRDRCMARERILSGSPPH